jgi:hypothetical protein
MTMPDLTLCTNIDCQFTDFCFRYKAKPSQYSQSYCRFEPDNDHCEFFIQIIDEPKQMDYLTKASELL